MRKYLVIGSLLFSTGCATAPQFNPRIHDAQAYCRQYPYECCFNNYNLQSQNREFCEWYVRKVDNDRRAQEQMNRDLEDANRSLQQTNDSLNRSFDQINKNNQQMIRNLRPQCLYGGDCD